MRTWIALVLLGTLALATGGGLLILNQHRTIALAGLGLGLLLSILGILQNLYARRVIRIEEKNAKTSAGTQAGLKRAIAALFIVVLVGLGTFYGASYLSSPQSSGTSSHTTGTQPTLGTTVSTVSSVIISTGVISTSRPVQSSTQTVTGGCTNTAKSIDGSAIEYNATGTSATVHLSTSQSQDVVIVFASAFNNPRGSANIPPNVTSVADSTSSLSFHKRMSDVTSVPNSSNDKYTEEEWYAVADAPLTSDAITVHLSATSPLLTIVAFGVAGTNASSPFDRSTGVPVAVTGSTQGIISATISTDCANDVILGGAVMYSRSPGVGQGYTLIQSDNGVSSGQDPIAEYQLVHTTQAKLNVTFVGVGQPPGVQTWILIADALN